MVTLWNCLHFERYFKFNIRANNLLARKSFLSCYHDGETNKTYLNRVLSDQSFWSLEVQGGLKRKPKARFPY